VLAKSWVRGFGRETHPDEAEAAVRGIEREKLGQE